MHTNKSNRAIVGVVLPGDRFAGRFLDNSIDTLLTTIADSCRALHWSAKQAAEFLMSQHWYGLDNCDWSKPPISMDEWSANVTRMKSRPAVGMGQTVSSPGVVEREFFTEKDDLWFVRHLYLISIPEETVGQYRWNGTLWELNEKITLPASAAVPAERPSSESSDPQ